MVHPLEAETARVKDTGAKARSSLACHTPLVQVQRGLVTTYATFRSIGMHMFTWGGLICG